MKTAPISVVIPAYNSERFIGEAIESVQAQTRGVDEIIVVDNNCTDDTRKIAVDLGVKLVDEKKQGVSAARNRGIAVCRNNWIAFIDSDDLWEEKKIEYQWNAIEKFGDARLITCDFDWMNESGAKSIAFAPVNKPEIGKNSETIIGDVYSYCRRVRPEVFRYFIINSSTGVIHREVFELVGRFDETLFFAQDLEFFQRALSPFAVASVKKSLANIRRHDQNRTNNQEDLRKFKRLVIERMLKFPEKYPEGMGKYFLELEKQGFAMRGKVLSLKKQETDH